MVTKESAAAAGLRRSRWTRWKGKLLQRMAWAWRPLLYAGILLGLMMGRAIPAAQIAPLGIAFYVGVRGAGFGALEGLAVGLSVIAGALLGLPASEALWVAGAVLVAHLGVAALRTHPARPRPLGAAVVAVVAAALPALMLTPRPAPLELAFWTGLTGVLAMIFTIGIHDVTSGRFLRVGTSDMPVPTIVLLAAALTGLQGITLWGWLSLHGVAAGLAVMAFAYAGGLALGASAGAVLGIGSFFTVLGSPAPTGPGAGLPVPDAQGMAYVVAGLLAGAFRDLKKPGVAAAYALAFTTYAMGTQGQGAVLGAMLISAGVAILLFLLTPGAWLVRLPVEMVLVRPPEQQADPEGDRPMPVALDRLRSMAQVMKEVHRTFEQVAAVATPDDSQERRPIEMVTERVCRNCSMNRQCWQKDLAKSYQLLTDLWADLEAHGPLPITEAPPALQEHCIHPDQVAFTLNHLHDLDQTRRGFARRLEEGRSIAGDYIRSVARLLDRMADEVAQSDGRYRPNHIPVFRMETAVARLPKRGGHISGDSFEAASLSEGRYLMALSDGMGVGQEASAQSRQCVRLLHQLLDAGFATEVAVRTVNSVLLLRSPEERFATVDMALLDLGTGRAEFVKVGAAPSFIKRGRDVTVVKMDTVPVGIINQVDVEPDFWTLRAGDLVVMITDGIWDVSKSDLDKERWILDFLAREPSQEPEEVAERLLARALSLMPVPEDDLCVLVGKVCPVEGGRGTAVVKSASGEWVPAQRAPRFQPLSRPEDGGARS